MRDKTTAMISVRDAARILNRTPQTVRNMIRSGALAGRKVRRGAEQVWRVSRDEVLAVADSNEIIASDYMSISTAALELGVDCRQIRNAIAKGYIVTDIGGFVPCAEVKRLAAYMATLCTIAEAAEMLGVAVMTVRNAIGGAYLHVVESPYSGVKMLQWREVRQYARWRARKKRPSKC